MQKKLSIIFICLFYFSLSAQDSSFIENIIYNGFGLSPNLSHIRSFSMGKTGVANTSNCNALFTNPGLLGKMDKINVLGSARGRFGIISDEKTEDSVDIIDETPYLNCQYSSNNIPPVFGLNGLSVGIPFRIEKYNIPFIIGVAVGYKPTYEFGFKNTTEYKFQNDTSVAQQRATIETKARGGHRTLSTGIGFGINDLVYLGFSLNFSIATAQSYNIESLIKTNQGKSEITVNTKYNCKGFYSTFGFGISPIQSLMIGLRFSHPMNMTFYDFEYEMIEDNITINEYTDEKEYEVRFPALFSAGVSWQPLDILTLALEYQTRAYAGIEIESDELELENGFCVRIGSELIIRSIPLRLGFSLESINNPSDKVVNVGGIPQVLRDDNLNLQFGPTLGASVPIGDKLTIDAAVGYDFFRKERIRLDTTTTSFNSDLHNIKIDLGITLNFDGLFFKNGKKSSYKKEQPKTNVDQLSPEPETIKEPEVIIPVTEEEVDPFNAEPESKVGEFVTITLDDGSVVSGILVSETDKVYVVDSDGEKVTLFKGIVISIE